MVSDRLSAQDPIALASQWNRLTNSGKYVAAFKFGMLDVVVTGEIDATTTKRNFASLTKLPEAVKTKTWSE